MGKYDDYKAQYDPDRKTLLYNEPSNGIVTLRLIISTIVSLFGSFQYGWHTGVVNLISGRVQKDLHIGHVEWGVAVGIFCVGGLVGASSISNFADKIGRKKALTLNSINFVIAGTLQFVSGAIQEKHHAAYGILLVSRIIAGIGCGAATVVVPMYLGEVANKNLRGAFGALNQFAVVVGLLISQLISTGLGGNSTWKWLLSISGFLGLLQVALGVVLLESPKWLATKNRLEQAKETLVYFRDYSEDDADAELDEIMLTAGKSLEKEKPSFYSIATDMSLRKPLIAAIVLTVSQQLSGINAVFYYSGTFFKVPFLVIHRLQHSSYRFVLLLQEAGTSSTLGTLLASAVNVLAMGVAVQLMEKAGRRRLLLSGSMGMCISALLIVIVMSIRKEEQSVEKPLGYVIIVLILSFVSFFEVGLGAIPWQIGGEIFPDGPRATAMSAAAMFNWISNGIIAVVFPVMVTRMEEFTFLPFVGVLFLNWLYTYRIVPETKGRTIAEILEAFHGYTPLTTAGRNQTKSVNSKSVEDPDFLEPQSTHTNREDGGTNFKFSDDE
eukprot:gb/GECG01000853.1/.p1 GENE.gb/GECG01000853.1/~~gb/GECG01000853.1/.p1  ORF type:complete len:552 (+),score=56.45 gb/GECG01000853.1/:1-1656(+)